MRGQSEYDQPSHKGYGASKNDEPQGGGVYGRPQPVKKTYYRVGEPQRYGSIYGYQKLRFPVYKCDENGIMMGDQVGYIKQERVPGLDGNIRGNVYYERNGWKKSGQLRFFDSPEALLKEYGMEPFVEGVTNAPQAPETVADADPLADSSTAMATTGDSAVTEDPGIDVAPQGSEATPSADSANETSTTGD